MFGIFGPIIFIISFLIQGLLRSGYNSLVHPISSLSIGQYGWIQVCTFIVTGISIFIFTMTLFHEMKNKMIAILLILVAIGLIASGIFESDPVYGYPSTLPLRSFEFTVHGKLHKYFSLLVFINLPITCFITAKYFKYERDTTWQLYSNTTGFIMMLLFLMITFAFRSISILEQYAGLLQRLCIIVGFTWIALLACYFKIKGEPNFKNRNSSMFNGSRDIIK